MSAQERGRGTQPRTRRLSTQQPAERDNQRLQGKKCQRGLVSKGLQSQDQGPAGASGNSQISMLYALPCLHMVTFILAKRQDHSDLALLLFLPVQHNLLQETFLQPCEGRQPGGMVIVTQCYASKDKPFQRTCVNMQWIRAGGCIAIDSDIDAVLQDMLPKMIASNMDITMPKCYFHDNSWAHGRQKV